MCVGLCVVGVGVGVVVIVCWMQEGAVLVCWMEGGEGRVVSSNYWCANLFSSIQPKQRQQHQQHNCCTYWFEMVDDRLDARVEEAVERVDMWASNTSSERVLCLFIKRLHVMDSLKVLHDNGVRRTEEKSWRISTQNLIMKHDNFSASGKVPTRKPHIPHSPPSHPTPRHPTPPHTLQEGWKEG